MADARFRRYVAIVSEHNFGLRSDGYELRITGANGYICIGKMVFSIAILLFHRREKYNVRGMGRINSVRLFRLPSR